MEVMLVEPTWTSPYLAYILHQKLPINPAKAKRVIRRSKGFTVINGELYKRSISGVLQRCIDPVDGQAILLEIHAGICGHHASSRALVAKALRARFYWPTAMQDAEELVRKCIGCQEFANKPHSPPSALKTIPLAWPFAQWGLEIGRASCRERVCQYV